MGRPGWSRKPCPGCGSEEGRPTGEVCNDCRTLMEDGERYREYVQELLEEEELGIYRYERAAHWNEGFLEAQANRRALEEAFHGVVMHLVRTELPDTSARLTMPDQRRGFRDAERLIPWLGRGFAEFNGGQSYVAAPPEQREAIIRLSTEIRAALRATYAAGHERGRSLVLGLAAGDLTEKEVNERAEKVVEAARAARGESS